MELKSTIKYPLIFSYLDRIHSLYLEGSLSVDYNVINQWTTNFSIIQNPVIVNQFNDFYMMGILDVKCY